MNATQKFYNNSDILTTLIWLTINELQKRKKIEIKYEPGIYVTNGMKMDWFFEVILLDNSTRNIGIKKIGFLMDNEIIPINFLDKDLKNHAMINTELFLNNVIYDEKIVENFFLKKTLLSNPILK